MPDARRSPLRVTAPYIRCDDLVDALASYLDEELSAQDRAEIDRHLAVCPECRDYLATYRDAIALARLSRSQDDELLAKVPESLVQAILAAKRSSPRS
jgi:anti-sigma factor RsiW